MKRLFTLLLVSGFLLAALPLPGGAYAPAVAQAASSPTSTSFTFYGIYDRIVASESLEEGEEVINHAVISGDGQKLAFATDNYIYTIDADGSNRVDFAKPDGSIRYLTIDQEGSRVFFVVQGPYRLFRIENGILTQILNAGDYDGIDSIEQIQTTADGEYVYFLDDGVNDNDVWQVAYNGGTPAKVIEDRDVNHSGYPGAQVKEFAISADASKIAFSLFAYWNPSYHAQEGLFVKSGDAYQQLTDPGCGSIHSPAISGDGNTIVYADGGTSRRYSIRSDGSNRIDLEYLGYNTAGPDLTYDGAQMFYNDHAANGGRVTNTNGAARIDLFPGAPIYLGATYGPSISDNGSRVAFVYMEGYTQFHLYVGYLNYPDAVPDAPHIHTIAFDPFTMPRDDPTARVILTSEISDPQGLADIQRIATSELLSGMLASGYGDCPAYFPFVARDDGVSPDAVAGDGIYSSRGEPGSQIDALDQVTIRMGAQDASRTVVVADTTLFIGSSGEMPLLPPMHLQAQPGIQSIALRWNPSPSPNLSGYNVYRATAWGGPWQLVNPAPIQGEYYLDTASLDVGATYFYYMTALDSDVGMLAMHPVGESISSNVAYAIYGMLEFGLPEAFGAHGAQVRLPVSIGNAHGLEMCAVELLVAYDPAVLSPVKVENTPLSAAYTWGQDFSTPGVAQASIAMTSGATLYGDGALFNLLFDVVGDSGATSNLAFQAAGSSFYDCDDLLNPAALDLSAAGYFTVQAGYGSGDLDGDGLVTAADADLALEIAVGKWVPSPEQRAAGDVDGDGQVEAADAVLVMRMASGLPLVPDVVQAGVYYLAQTEVITVAISPDGKLFEGEGGWVDISISEAGSLAGVDLVLNYDPYVATMVGARVASLSAHLDVAYHVPVPGRAMISLKPQVGHEDGLSGGSGALISVQFMPASSASVGDTTPLSLAVVRLSDLYGRDFTNSALQLQVNALSGALSVVRRAIFLPLMIR